jgi:hypothetical protein
MESTRGSLSNVQGSLRRLESTLAVHCSVHAAMARSVFFFFGCCQMSYVCLCCIELMSTGFETDLTFLSLRSRFFWQKTPGA